MKAFADLLERLAFEPRRTAKIVLIRDYFRQVPDPDRGYALAALAGTLDIPLVKPALLKSLIAARSDPTLFALSYDFVGDLSETIALMWPAGAPFEATVPGGERLAGDRLAGDGLAGDGLAGDGLGAVVESLATARRGEAGTRLAALLDRHDEGARWALLKLCTGALRVGVSALLAKQALAAFGQVETAEIEEIWHAQAPPYAELFAWLEGHAPRPVAEDALAFVSPMLAHPIEAEEFLALDPAEFAAEWKWDGIRVQAMARPLGDGRFEARLFSRSGEELSQTFPDLVAALAFDGAIDGELVVLTGDRVAPFAALQQRLNRKKVSEALIRQYPAHLIAYDLLAEGGEDVRALPFSSRRARLEGLFPALAASRTRLSPLIDFASWEALAERRAESAGEAAIEGVMLKRISSPYLAGRPKGHWYKWKRDPGLVDCVLMYAQRGHGKRSSYYSDFTFGVWDGEALVPVGKSYFGFTDAELAELDRFVRRNTVNRFGPVREVTHTADQGLVFEIAFEGLQASSRHKSGIAMRFPRIHRIRWDKRPAEADAIATLRGMLSPGLNEP